MNPDSTAARRSELIAALVNVNVDPIQASVLADTVIERRRQDVKWGSQRDHSPFQWYSILGEEVGEVGQEINDAWVDHFGFLSFEQVEALRKELVQVAAVAVVMAESLGESPTPTCGPEVLK